jgi:hypothetical protein
MGSCFYLHLSDGQDVEQELRPISTIIGSLLTFLCPDDSDIVLSTPIPYIGNRDPWGHEVVVRHERQTFRRLARSNTILFTMRTYMNNLVDMNEEDLAGFAAVVRAWPDDVASYKGRDFWGPVASYC